MPKHAAEELLLEMKRSGASDLVLTVGTPPQYRINGAFRPYGDRRLQGEDTASLAQSLLSPSDAQTLKVERSVDFSKGIPGVARYRVNVYYQRDSIAMAIRLIPYEIPGFDTLGLPPIVQDLATRPHGLVLITGPAGSGKSTTMAAMIDYINHTRHLHIVCIEDPIEYVHSHQESVIDQREIGEDARTFSEAMRSVFRQSPDVIMVGELRDIETMALAMTLAETGHLILATLHTQDTTNAISRIVDSFPVGQQRQISTQLSLVLQGIVSQQLLVTRDGTRRVLATEVLNVDNAVRNLIREGEIQQLYSVVQTGRALGMMTMNDSLKRLLDADLIEAETARMRSPRLKELLRMMGSV